LIVAIVYTGHVTALPENITIGGIFDVSSVEDEAVFQYAVDQINQQSNLLPGSRVVGWTERVNLTDSFHTSKKVCELLGYGISALVGPSSPSSGSQVRSLCEAKNLPYIEVGMPSEGSSSINLFPHPSSLAMAYSSVVTDMDWKDYLILYEDINRLNILQELLGRKDAKVTVRKLDTGPTGTVNDYRSQLKEIKLAGHRQIILDCSSENIHHILSHAMQVGMMTEYQTYLVTNLDMHTVDMVDIKLGGAKIRALRLVNPYNETPQTNILRIQERIFDGRPLKTESAVIYDSLLLWAKAMTSLGRSKNIEVSTSDCETETFWEYGTTLINHMKQEETWGLTGRIKLDDFGFRTDFNLEIVEYNNEGLKTVGSWDPMNGAVFSSKISKRDTRHKELELVVSMILSEPFVMPKIHELLSNNGTCVASFLECYEGFSIDLLKTLSKEVKFRFTINLVEDGKYGQYDEERQQWSGLVGELQSQKADLVIADLTITKERSEVIDFTMPFMNTGITILFKKQFYGYNTPGLSFAFLLTPFQLDLWLCILAAYFAISLVLYIFARFDPVEINTAEESSNRSEDLLHSSNEKETFTVINSFWFILASGLAQKVDFLPKAFSTRLIVASWWLFVLIMISSYIANLVTFANFDRPLTEREKIQSVEDLAKQHKIKYGTVQGGSTAAFFRDSENHLYSEMWANMNDNKNVFVQSTKEGVERVRKEAGKYAFFAESTAVDYVIVKSECDLKQVGGLLDNKGYGIGLPKDSPYYEQINSGVLELQKDGVLKQMKLRWWWEEGECESYNEYKGHIVPSALEPHYLSGIFLILSIGILLACVISCGECLFIWWKKRRCYEA